MKLKTLVSSLAVAVLLVSGIDALAQRGDGELDTSQPQGITVDQIIQKFAAREKQFKLAREQYTWRQDVKVQTLEGNTVDGEYRSVVDIIFDDKGRRTENVVFAPQSTLQRISMSKEDLDDIEKRMPFVLTSDEIGLYNIKYAGKQQVDELTTYVFDLQPKTIEKNQRYFEGRIWVDDHDFMIVKTYGKNVPDIGVGGKKARPDNENLFPRFTTYREQIDGQHWFPTYTKVDDTLHFSNGDVHIRQIVRYTNYKRFGSSSKITFEGQEVKNAPGQQPEKTEPERK
jgi:hypothetical protein